jgi:hypothetical protein
MRKVPGFVWSSSSAASTSRPTGLVPVHPEFDGVVFLP